MANITAARQHQEMGDRRARGRMAGPRAKWRIHDRINALAILDRHETLQLKAASPSARENLSIHRRARR